MMKFKQVFLFCLGCSFFAGATDTTNILFIGNSFTGNNDMPGIFQKISRAKQKIVHVEKSWKGGASLRDQTSRPELFQSIKKGNWDVVVVQGWSKEFIQKQAYIDSVTLPYARQILDTIRTYNPCAKILFYETWGYRDGSDMDSVMLSYEQMSDTIIKGYALMNSIFKHPVVPVGRTWLSFRQKYPDVNLYDTDLYHPSKLGSYLAACTFYTCIFHESPVGASTKTISYADAKLIQTHCEQTVLPALNANGFTSDYFNIVTETDGKGRYKLKAEAHYGEDSKITWVLAKDKVFKGSALEYYYTAPGSYKVRLKVESPCGTRWFAQKITFKAKPKIKK
jgi:hypothetical protein